MYMSIRSYATFLTIKRVALSRRQARKTASTQVVESRLAPFNTDPVKSDKSKCELKWNKRHVRRVWRWSMCAVPANPLSWTPSILERRHLTCFMLEFVMDAPFNLASSNIAPSRSQWSSFAPRRSAPRRLTFFRLEYDKFAFARTAMLRSNI
jgi:hypothetical protein